MSAEHNPYVTDIPEEVRQHLEFISTCRHSPPCPVPDKHWFYPVPDRPPFYYGKRPCMPVVPTRVVKGKVMILGAYPTCRFATIRQGEHIEQYVPVGDIDEPFENSRYFDNYNVRDVRSGDVLYDCYLDLLGLDENEDLWITNLVKCFLFKQGHINAYDRLGWTTPHVETTRDEYFNAAAVCMWRNLAREIELCEPQLIITMGAEVCRMMHKGESGESPAPYDHFDDVVGKLLPANPADSDEDTRIELFRGINVFHMYHPGFLMREDDEETSEEQKVQIAEHYDKHIPAVRKFLVEHGLGKAAQIEGLVVRKDIKALKPYVDWDHAQDML